MANTTPQRRIYVQTPRGRIVDVHHRNGTVTMELQWNPGFSTRMNRNFNNAQEYVDSEVIRFMVPYTPMRNGILYKSATLGTVIGSGMIHQVAPYARFQYYGNVMVSSITGSAWARHGESKILTNRPLHYDTSRHPQAGKMWFERMKADKKEIILRGVRRYMR
ncbi:MAG: minor capsid protein [Acutalibacteraceae bacterium]|nr:minor capsid protein [Acutalibacteraceae bacterium]